MAGHELRVIGDVELAVADVTIRLPPQQAKVLAILAAAPPGYGVTREELVHGLWPTAPDGGRLWTVVSKLRMALRPLGVTVSPGRGTAGYTLAPLPGPDGVRPVDILDLTAVTRLLERGEQLLEQGSPVAAIEVLAEAAARWRGRPFTVGDGWPLPRLCRAAAERLDVQQRRLARAWVRAGLLADDLGALTWIDVRPELAAGLAADRDVWLLRFIGALVAGDPSAAEAMLEERRPEWGYADPLTIRAAQLLELSERGAELTAPAGPATPHPAADPDVLRDWVAALPAGVAALLSVPDPGGRAQPTAVQQLRAAAAGHGIRTFRAVCDTADDLAPWRALLRDIWAAALRDPQFEPETQLPVLAETVASPRPSPVQPGALAGLGRAAVVLLAALSRRRPLLIIIDDARRLSTAAAELLVRIRADLRGARVGFAVVGADGGRFDRTFDRTTLDRTTEVLVVDSRPAPDPGPGAPSDWLCAAALTAVDGRIDPVVVARVLGVDAARADAGMAAAFRQGAIALTGGARFASAQARRDVLSELAADPARSRRLHRAVFDELTGGPAPGAPDPARVAEHALAARPDLPDEVVATACLAAAAAEQAARRHGSAVEFAVRGLALAVDPQLRFALQIVHGDSRHDRADIRAAQTAYRAAYAEASESVAMRAVAAVRLARRWSDPGRIDESLLSMLRSTRDELDAQGDPRLVELWMQVSGHLAHKSTMALPLSGPAGELPPGVRIARRTLDALLPNTTPEVACEVLTECRWALYDFAPPAEVKSISDRLQSVAAASGSDHFRAEALIATLIDHLRIGDVGTAQQACEAHRAHVESTGHGLGPWLQVTLDNVFDLWDGDLAAAERRLFGPSSTMLRARRRDQSDSLQQTWMGQAFWLRREQARAPELIGYGIGRMVERRRYFPVWAAGMALLLSEVGQPAAATDQLLALLDQTDQLHALPPNGWAVSTLALIAETVDHLCRHRPGPQLDLPDLARRVDDLLAPHTDELVLAGWPSVLLGPVRRARGLLALAVGDVEAAQHWFADAMRTVGASPAQVGWLRLYQARALLAGASAGASEQARELLRAALAAAEPRGMGALAAAARQQLARI